MFKFEFLFQNQSCQKTTEQSVRVPPVSISSLQCQMELQKRTLKKLLLVKWPIGGNFSKNKNILEVFFQKKCYNFFNCRLSEDNMNVGNLTLEGTSINDEDFSDIARHDQTIFLTLLTYYIEFFGLFHEFCNFESTNVLNENEYCYLHLQYIGID